MKLIPTKNKILVKPTKSDSIFGDSKNYMGEILSVGSSVKDFKVGQTIVFLPHACDDTPEIEGIVYTLVENDPSLILLQSKRKSHLELILS